jgi:hypothetical protein
VHRAIDVYGLGVVARATKLEPSRLKAEHGRRRPSRSRSPSGATVPSYSLMDLVPPSRAVGERPLAEVETPVGVKVRLFGATAETMGLVLAYRKIESDLPIRRDAHILPHACHGRRGSAIELRSGI